MLMEVCWLRRDCRLASTVISGAADPLGAAPGAGSAEALTVFARTRSPFVRGVRTPTRGLLDVVVT
jgi:hypothetical protein